MTDKLLLTREEAAEVAGVSTDRIDRWLTEPGFPVIREGYMIRIHAALFDQWLRARATASRPEPPPVKINAPRTQGRAS